MEHRLLRIDRQKTENDEPPKRFRAYCTCGTYADLILRSEADGWIVYHRRYPHLPAGLLASIAAFEETQAAKTHVVDNEDVVT